MKLVIKHFNDLTLNELVDIYKLRVSIFVVEQKCVCQEVDDADKVAYHLWLEDEDGIEAYARVLPRKTTFEEASIGRVVAKKRRCGLATRIVNEAIKVAKEKFNETTLKIAAQVYAKGLYEKCGFVQVSEPFLEDGIYHIQMLYESNK